MSDHDRSTQVQDLMRRWAAAEQAGDADALDALLTADFAGIGPHGFQLDKEQWLARYRSGDLVNEAFTIDEATARCYGTASIVNGVQRQQAAYGGHPVDGRFRLTAVLVAQDHSWQIANVQLSAIPGQ